MGLLTQYFADAQKENENEFLKKKFISDIKRAPADVVGQGISDLDTVVGHSLESLPRAVESQRPQTFSHPVGSFLNAIVAKPEQVPEGQTRGFGSYLGQTLGDVVRSGLKLETSGQATLNRSIQLAEAQKEIEDNRLKTFMENQNSGAEDGSRPYVSSYKIGDTTIDFPKPTSVAKREAQQKAISEATTGQVKEATLASSKANRLERLADFIGKKFQTTSPYSMKNKAVKAGMMPLLGAADIAKKGFQATDAQKNDKLYADFVDGVRAQLARGMGDVGNLSEYEQKAVLKLVPTLMDTAEVGAEKIRGIKELAAEIRKARDAGFKSIEELYESTEGSSSSTADSVAQKFGF